MDRTRAFSSAEGNSTGARTVEDAPGPMRQEFVAALYALSDKTISFTGSKGLDVDRDLYLTIEQLLGVQAAGNPQPSRRQRIGRDIGQADWPRVYDLVVALWHDFEKVGIHKQYREVVNRLLSAYNIAWDLGPDGQMRRVMPPTVTAQIKAAFEELHDPQYSAALALAILAQQAYDARPRRDRDACANAFDAMESVAQQRFNLAGRGFDDVLKAARQRNVLASVTLDVLEKLNVLRHRTFGHGTAQPFSLTAAETDFIYLSCMSGLLLFVRL